MSLRMQKDLDYATEHTHTHHFYHSQNNLQPRNLTAREKECGEKGKYSDKKLATGRSPSYLVMLSICFTLWEHVMCLSKYLFSHYDMCLGAMRKVCMPKAKKFFFYIYIWEKVPPTPRHCCFFVLRVSDKRNCANEPLKSLNGCGLRTMAKRMQHWTKAGPCPTISHFSDGSERTHEHGLVLELQRRHLAPHWAKQ